MVVALVFVAVILGAVVVGITTYNANHKVAALPQSSSVTSKSTVPDGSVDSVANALTLDASNDSSSADADISAEAGADVTNNSAQGIEGSYDENSF